jgi:hypothetical protein
VNYKPGKTECLVVFRGRGATAARCNLYGDMQGRISFTAYGATEKAVICTNVYKHMGTMTTLSGTLRPEIRQRLAMMASSLVPLRKRVLKEQRIPSPKRFAIARTLLLTRGLFQCAAWPALNATEFGPVHAAVMKVYRTVDGSDTPDARVTDDEVLERHDLAAPHVLLTAARLLLFIKVVGHASFDLLTILAHAMNAKRSWLRAVRP